MLCDYVEFMVVELVEYDVCVLVIVWFGFEWYFVLGVVVVVVLLEYGC